MQIGWRRYVSGAENDSTSQGCRRRTTLMPECACVICRSLTSLVACRCPVIQGVFRFGPFDIGRVRYFDIDAALILGAPTPLAPGGTFATGFGRFGIAIDTFGLPSNQGLKPSLSITPRRYLRSLTDVGVLAYSCLVDLIMSRTACLASHHVASHRVYRTSRQIKRIQIRCCVHMRACCTCYLTRARIVRALHACK